MHPRLLHCRITFLTKQREDRMILARIAYSGSAATVFYLVAAEYRLTALAFIVAVAIPLFKLICWQARRDGRRRAFHEVTDCIIPASSRPDTREYAQPTPDRRSAQQRA